MSNNENTMNKFKGFAIGKATRFKNNQDENQVGAGGILVRLTHLEVEVKDTTKGAPKGSTLKKWERLLDGTGQPMSVVVDLKAGPKHFDRYEAAGLGKQAEVTFDAIGWYEFDENADRTMPAQGSYPETPIHRIAELDYDSVTVTRAAKVAPLEHAADKVASPSLLAKVASAFNGSKGTVKAGK